MFRIGIYIYYNNISYSVYIILKLILGNIEYKIGKLK